MKLPFTLLSQGTNEEMHLDNTVRENDIKKGCELRNRKLDHHGGTFPNLTSFLHHPIMVFHIPIEKSKLKTYSFGIGDK